MSDDDYRQFSESMMKRLYWSGYQGRFASVRWMTYSTDDFLIGARAYLTFDDSEYIALKAGGALAGYFHTLRTENPSSQISVTAHSMGNVVMMEALKQTVAAGRVGNNADIDNYVMMQAAAPAQSFHADFPNFRDAVIAEARISTPDLYRGYPGSIKTAVRSGIIANFFNPLDYALVTGTYLGLSANYKDHKLSMPVNGYSYQGGVCKFTVVAGGMTGGSPISYTRIVSDSYEQLSHIARPRSYPAGGTQGLRGQVNRELDLNQAFGFSLDRSEHSAEFNWNVQRLKGFYDSLLNNLFDN